MARLRTVHVPLKRFSLQMLVAFFLVNGAYTEHVGLESFSTINEQDEGVGIDRVFRPNPATFSQCHYYNETLCTVSNASRGCNGSEQCPIGEGNVDRDSPCYVLWVNSSGVLSIKLKGCWLSGNREECASRGQCTVTRRDESTQLLFCCCDGHLCNDDTLTPVAMLPRKSVNPDKITPFPPLFPNSIGAKQVAHQEVNERGSSRLAVLVLTPLFALTVCASLVYWLYRRRALLFGQGALFNVVPTMGRECDFLPSIPSRFRSQENAISPAHELPVSSLRLLEVKGQGRFGAVWKALYTGKNGTSPQELVAVKVFPPQDEHAWMFERDIYRLDNIRHECVVKFLGTTRRHSHDAQTGALHTEYWLVLAYYSWGSLYDYLKCHRLTYVQMLSLMDCIARGLMHLHEEIPDVKPAITHRDFKSKNVLVREDGHSCCVADLGLALVFEGGVPRAGGSQQHGQIGTRRYMAPEVLEGAINFDQSAFQRIDMYSCALVFWELLSRCDDFADAMGGEYRLPYEEYVGLHPTLDAMQECVVQLKRRPPLPRYATGAESPIALPQPISRCVPQQYVTVQCAPSASVAYATSQLNVTIEECWDHDAEARLSACCVHERLTALARALRPNATPSPPADTPDDGETDKLLLESPIVESARRITIDREPLV